jgi:hypothetical protein
MVVYFYICLTENATYTVTPVLVYQRMHVQSTSIGVEGGSVPNTPQGTNQASS